MSHPGDLLLAPPSVVALGAIAINDHVLKARFGGVVTGKLSDVAGVFVFPLLILSVLECGRWLVRRSGWASRPGEVLGAVTVTAVGFAAVKLSPAVAGAYGATIGALRWVVGAAVAAVVGSDVSYRSIEVIVDPTDLVVLPVLVASAAVALARRRVPVPQSS